MDGDRFADLDLGPPHSVQRDVAQYAEGNFNVGKIGGQLLYVVLLRNADIAGLELGRHQPVGGVVAAADHTVPDGHLIDLFAHGIHDADGGVAQTDRLEPGLLGRAGRTAPADAIHLRTGADLCEMRAHEDLIGGRKRHIELFNFNLSRRCEHEPLSLGHAKILFCCVSDAAIDRSA